MKKYGKLLFEIIVVFIAIIYVMITMVIPDIKKSQGSSDSFIKSSKYSNFIEVKIDNKTDFAIITDKEGKIYHLFFFDNTAVFLYNQNIENRSISSGLERIVAILIENQLLNSNSSIEVIRDNDKYYSEFKNNFINLLNKYSINNSIIEKTQSIDIKANELEMDSNSISELLLEMDFYSKEIVKDSNISISEEMNSNNSLKYANKVYKKIESDIYQKNITNISKDEVDIAITLIPGDSNNKYYPTSNSWYYVKDKKVYAYIEFINDNQKYSYCYNGSIDIRMEGECNS